MLSVALPHASSMFWGCTTAGAAGEASPLLVDAGRGVQLASSPDSTFQMCREPALTATISEPLPEKHAAAMGGAPFALRVCFAL